MPSSSSSCASKQSRRGALLFFLLLSMRSTQAVPPSQVNGNYTWECSADANLTLTLLLSGGDNNQGGGQARSQMVPIYCGPPNPTTPPEQVTRWNEYQQRLDMAEDDFEAGCNQLVTNLGIFAPPDADCTEAAANWREGLEEINNSVAGLAPGHLVMEVNPGGPAQEILGLWNTWSTLTLQDGRILNLNYLINGNGKIWSIGGTGQVNMATQAAGCAGGLVVVSEGFLYGDSSTVSTLRNDYGGLLACGVAGGGLWIVVAATAAVNAATSAVRFDKLPTLPTDPPLPTPTDPPVTHPNPNPQPGPKWCFSGRSLVHIRNTDADDGMKGTWKRMDELQIGDEVLTEDGSYSKIYSFAHYAPNYVGDYLQIQADGMIQPLEISAKHMIYRYDDAHENKYKKTLVPAQDIKIGDSLVSGVDGGTPAKVHSIRKVQQRGVFAPYTFSGDIVVNHVMASNYVMLPEEFPGMSPGKQHFMHHALNAPHRVYCRLVGCAAEDEEYDERTGFSTSVSLQFALLQWYTHQSKPFQWAWLHLVTPLGDWVLLITEQLFICMSHLEMAHLLVAILGYHLWCKVYKKTCATKSGGIPDPAIVKPVHK